MNNVDSCDREDEDKEFIQFERGRRPEVGTTEETGLVRRNVLTKEIGVWSRLCSGGVSPNGIVYPCSSDWGNK